MKIKILSFALLIFSISTVIAQNTPTDCVNAIIICGNTDLELNSNGTGINDFSLPGNNAPSCGFSESQSLWLRVTIVQDGTLAFTITPESTNADEDYDFAVYGPNVDCTSLGSSIRCSSTNPPAAGVGTQTGLSDTETDLTEGPGGNGNGFVRSIDALAGEEYYILIDNFSQNGGFDLEFTGTAMFPDSPMNAANGTNLDLTECDIIGDATDGITNFDIETNTVAILGTQTNVDISYHITDQDANTDANPISGTFLSTRNNQTIYIRIENTITGCFIIDTFTLITLPRPQITDPTPLHTCDTAADGDDTNGFATFLLQDKDSEILNTIDPNSVTVSYHLTQNDADLNTNPIDKTSPFSNTTAQRVFVRIEEVTNPTCASFTQLDLIVDPLPDAIATTLTQCDIDTDPTDGITLYNLEEAIPSLTNNVNNVTATFAEDMAFSSLISNTQNYTNTTNGQIVYIRIQDNTTNCFRDTTLTLNTLVVTVSNVIHRHCDDDGTEDGIFTFDIANIQNTILNTLSIPTGATVAIYENENDAILEQNELTTSFTNTTPNTQTIYARIENNNNCFGISEITLTVDTLPNIETEGSAFLCENDSVILNPGLLEGTLGDFTYLWSTGETSPSITVTSDGTYSVTITNANGCQKDRTITVTLSNSATIDVIDIMDVSDNNTVTINASGLGDYEYAIEFNGQQPTIFQDSNVFTNVPPGFHRVLIRDKNGCLPITTQDIAVVGFPKFFTPNGDSFNDTWNVKGVSSTHLGNSLIYIFDRYGKLLTQINPLGNGWDGNYNKRPMPSSSYWYRVELEDGRLLKGSFVLKR